MQETFLQKNINNCWELFFKNTKSSTMKKCMLEIYQYIYIYLYRFFSIIIIIICIFLWEIIKRKIFPFTLDVLVNKTSSHKTCSHLKTKLKNSLKKMQLLQTRIIQSKKFILTFILAQPSSEKPTQLQVKTWGTCRQCFCCNISHTNHYQREERE